MNIGRPALSKRDNPLSSATGLRGEGRGEDSGRAVAGAGSDGRGRGAPTARRCRVGTDVRPARARVATEEEAQRARKALGEALHFANEASKIAREGASIAREANQRASVANRIAWVAVVLAAASLVCTLVCSNRSMPLNGFSTDNVSLSGAVDRADSALRP
jgi:hypothetical protein